jgi:hypothetical protein
MKKNEMMERMPKMMKQAMGEAQKKLTVWEGSARKYLKGTYSKLMEYPSMKKMTERMGETMDKMRAITPAVEPIRKRVDQVRTTISQKAAATMGLATKTDIRSIRQKVEKLRDEIRKFTRRPSAKPAAQPSTRAQ